jgi:hypothetical protein
LYSLPSSGLRFALLFFLHAYISYLPWYLYSLFPPVLNITNLLFFLKFLHVPLHIALSTEEKFNCTVFDAAKSLLYTSSLSSYFFNTSLLFSRCVCTKLYVTYFSDLLMCRELCVSCRVLYSALVKHSRHNARWRHSAFCVAVSVRLSVCLTGSWTVWTNRVTKKVTISPVIPTAVTVAVLQLTICFCADFM